MARFALVILIAFIGVACGDPRPPAATDSPDSTAATTIPVATTTTAAMTSIPATITTVVSSG